MEQVDVRLKHGRVHAADCEDCESTDGRVDVIDRSIRIRGDLDAAEFYVTRALAQAKKENNPTDAIEHDLQTIQRLKAERR